MVNHPDDTMSMSNIPLFEHYDHLLIVEQLSPHLFLLSSLLDENQWRFDTYPCIDQSIVSVHFPVYLDR